MAKIQIIIEDLDNGNVTVKSTPEASEIGKIANYDKEATAAYVYASVALGAIRKVHQGAEKEFKKDSSLLMPGCY